jgi:hypothetical protein
VIDVSNDGHVTDVSPSVHQSTDLLNGEVNHLGGFFSSISLRGDL